MKPRTLHLLLLGVTCLGPLVGGGFLALMGTDSHTEMSGVLVAIGAVGVGAALGYTGITSLLFWKLGSSLGRVAAIHGGLWGLVLLLLAVRRC